MVLIYFDVARTENRTYPDNRDEGKRRQGANVRSRRELIIGRRNGDPSYIRRMLLWNCWWKIR